MTMAGNESGRPRGGSVMIARALSSCSRMSAGAAMSARPQAGEREASPPQAATTIVKAKRRGFICPNLIRPGSGDGDRAHRFERLGDEIVHVVERIGHEESDLERSGDPAGAEVQHSHGNAPRVDVALELDLFRPAREAVIGAETPRAARSPGRVVRGHGEQVPGPKGEEGAGVEVLVRHAGCQVVWDRRGEERRV